MGTDRRHLWIGVCLGVLLLVSGCATRGSVRRLEEQVTALRTKIEATDRNVVQLGSTLKDSETRLGEQGRGVETLAQRVERLERLDAKLQDFDRTLKEVKASIEALRPQVTRPAPRAGPASAEQAYASAQAHYQGGNFGQAVLEFTDLMQHFSRHALAENAQYWVAASYLAHRDYRQALVEFRRVLDNYPGGRKTPDALYQVGVCYRNLFEPQRAREVWQELIQRFPGSDTARLARTALRGLSARRGR